MRCIECDKITEELDYCKECYGDSVCIAGNDLIEPGFSILFWIVVVGILLVVC